MRTNWLKNAVLIAVLATTTFLYTSCGTLLYPERRGQTGGKIDPGVAILDGVGLVLFIIPGLIAFAIDFSTGAIYLPPEKPSPDRLNVQSGSGDMVNMVAIPVDKQELTKAHIEMLVKEHTGVSVDLGSPNVVATRLDAGDQTSSAPVGM